MCNESKNPLVDPKEAAESLFLVIRTNNTKNLDTVQRKVYTEHHHATNLTFPDWLIDRDAEIVRLIDLEIAQRAKGEVPAKCCACDMPMLDYGSLGWRCLNCHYTYPF